MCMHCACPADNNVGEPVWLDDSAPHEREVPERSGEGAIYSLEHLARKEGNRRGTDPYRWRSFMP